jgi:hypothetical protein
VVARDLQHVVNVKEIKQNACAKLFAHMWQNNLIWEAFGLKSVYFGVKARRVCTSYSSAFFIMGFS